mmetsp:Transcript_16001/g.48064  ORF Transcript_16001/g.48064 Transcript_16001/m.48064 type:complete len:382 (+) Transcript_16001:209-1354(+)
MAAHLALANQYVADERTAKALEAFGASIAEEPTAAAYSGRAALHLKSKQHTAALQDANAALRLSAACEPALYRKGLACFELDEFETALEAFKAGETAADAELRDLRKYAMWIRKCEAEIEDDDDDDDSEEDVAEVEAGTDAAPSTPAPPIASAPALESGVRVVPCTVKYQYYQTSTHLTITVLAQRLTEADTCIEIKEKTIIVKICKDGTEMTVISGELYDPVIADECRVKYYNSKVDIKLKKKEAYNWNDLLKGDLIGEPKIVPPTRRPAASTTNTSTPYASARDWNRLEKEMEAELEKDKPEGEEALNKLFKDIYGKATPETRRAMNKSFQTSGGTVLSTNWGEVGTTDYEDPDVRQAPAGMEWKSWEGKKMPQKENND